MIWATLPTETLTILDSCHTLCKDFVKLYQNLKIVLY